MISRFSFLDGTSRRALLTLMTAFLSIAPAQLAPAGIRRLWGLALFLTVILPPAVPQSLGLAPAQVDYRFQPGQPFEFDLSVSNEGRAPVVMRATVSDLWYNDKNEKVFDRPGSSPRSAANWIEVVPPQIAIPGDSTAKVKVVITPPAHASGGYYAAVFLESKPELMQDLTEEGKAFYTSIRLGSLILLSARNTESYNIELSDARVTSPDDAHPFRLDINLANNSNTHIFPDVRIGILNARRELVARTEAEIRRFLPQQSDRLSASWAGSLPPGQYVAILTIIVGSDRVYTTDLPFSVGDYRLAQSVDPTGSR